MMVQYRDKKTSEQLTNLEYTYCSEYFGKKNRWKSIPIIDHDDCNLYNVVLDRLLRNASYICNEMVLYRICYHNLAILRELVITGIVKTPHRMSIISIFSIHYRYDQRLNFTLKYV